MVLVGFGVEVDVEGVENGGFRGIAKRVKMKDGCGMTATELKASDDR